MSKRPALHFTITHSAPKHATGFGELRITIRPDPSVVYSGATVDLSWQSSGDAPEVWYAFTVKAETHSYYGNPSDVARLLTRVAKCLEGQATNPANVLQCLSGIAVQAAWNNCESREVPLSELPPVGTECWRDVGSDPDRAEYCTVHVEAKTPEEAQRKVLQALAAKHPDRIETWIARGKQVRHLWTQQENPKPWNEWPMFQTAKPETATA